MLDIELSAEEVEVLKEELKQILERMEIETSRTDKIEYRKMLKRRIDVLETVYTRLAGQHAL